MSGPIVAPPSVVINSNMVPSLSTMNTRLTLTIPTIKVMSFIMLLAVCSVVLGGMYEDMKSL